MAFLYIIQNTVAKKAQCICSPNTQSFNDFIKDKGFYICVLKTKYKYIDTMGRECPKC